MMGELEFVGHMNPRRLTSFAEDFKKEQGEFLSDELKRKSGKVTPKTAMEVTYVRFPNSDLEDYCETSVVSLGCSGNSFSHL